MDAVVLGAGRISGVVSTAAMELGLSVVVSGSGIVVGG